MTAHTLFRGRNGSLENPKPDTLDYDILSHLLYGHSVGDITIDRVCMVHYLFEQLLRWHTKSDMKYVEYRFCL